MEKNMETLEGSLIVVKDKIIDIDVNMGSMKDYLYELRDLIHGFELGLDLNWARIRVS